MPQPAIPTPSLQFKGFDKFLDELEQGLEIKAGVASVGEAAAYSFVWEYGNIRQVKEGPNTVKGINPDGEVVWLSVQAPSGYIAINETLYQEVLSDELSKVKFSGRTAGEIKTELKDAILRAMERIRDIISKNAPVDSGDLSDSFKVIKPGNSLLNSEDERTFEPGV